MEQKKEGVGDLGAPEQRMSGEEDVVLQHLSAFGVFLGGGGQPGGGFY